MKNIKPQGKSRTGYFIFHILFLLLFVTSGCGNKFFDPSQVGRFDHTPAVNVILEKLGPAEEIPVAWEQGEEPRPIDTVANQSDYTLMSGDIIRISIHELLTQGMTYVEDFEVSETGRVSIPLVGTIRVKGVTEIQLEEMIKNVLSSGILVNPLVHVTLLQSQQRAYSIQGDGVRMPNRYPIPRYEWRLLDALAQAGGASQKNVTYVYVTRKVRESEKNSGISKNGIKDFRAIESAYNLKEPVTPESIRRKQTSSNNPISKVVISSSEMVLDRETNRYSRNNNRYRNNMSGRSGGRNVYQFSDMQAENIEENRVSVDEVLRRVTGRSVNTIEEPVMEEPEQDTIIRQPQEEPDIPDDSEYIRWEYQNDEWVAVKVEPSESKEPKRENKETFNIPDTRREVPDEQVDWILQDGRYVPVPVERGVIDRTDTVRGDRELTWVEQSTETRLIKIPIDRLIAGESRYNIVIKPGDSILVPHDVAGVYYLKGHLNRTGEVEMTGGMVTLKQAIATAGDLGPLAWPQRCEIIRRIGRNKEITVRVDLEKIFKGEQPDIYIKPHDIINVGTHATSIWRAALRNAFRASYGFGFVYDRNFAVDDYYPNPWF